MKIPEKIRIAGVDYTVKCSDVVLGDNQLCYGKIDWEKSEIELNTKSAASHQRRCITILHEILHGILFHYNSGEEIENEEKIVTIISKGLYQVLQDNGGALFDLAQPTQEHTCPNCGATSETF